MFYRVSEKQMHAVRWLLVVCWIGLIFSLFYDPISVHLTDPNNQFSPFRLDINECVQVQGKCLEQKPYAMGAYLFWGNIIPIALMVLLVLGHETWRRICPLSFLSQIPRALGWQRQRQVVNPDTGAVRYELAKVGKDSWLGRNHLYLQFSLLFIGLSMRVLFVNSDRLVLGSFFILTILSAILVGYLYGGKSWCHYFCPMAPVQMVYTGPRGLLGSEAHQGQREIITQSMCRTVDKEGNEKSACVSCQSPCLDIDAERSYWEILTKPGRKLVQYGYVGLVIGFYTYYLLYSGNLEYYFSGAWAHEENQLGTIFSPGFYILNQQIPIPKIIAVPLTMGLVVAISYFIFDTSEKLYKNHRKRIKKPLNYSQLLHIFFSICTFLAFNFYFIFGGRTTIRLLPLALQLGFNFIVAIVSTLWLYRTLGRSAETYSRESLANSLRRQLSKLTIDFSKFLEGRSMEDLKPDEVYVLAKVLPGFNQEHGLQVYKGLVREALEQGNVNSANSLEVLKQIRLGLGIKDDEHFTVLTELGIENPDLLDPRQRRTRENHLRLESYRQGLELQLLELVETGMPLTRALQQKEKQIQALKLEYGITAEEEAQVLTRMSGENSAILRTAEAQLAQLKVFTVRYQVLNNLVPNSQAPVFVLLRLVAMHQQQIVTKQLLSILEILGDAPEAMRIASSTIVLAENVLPDILQVSDGAVQWQARLNSKIIDLLRFSESVPTVQPPAELVIPDDEAPTVLRILMPKAMLANRLESVIDVLKELLQELDPLVQAASLYALEQLDPKQGREQAHQLVNLVKPEDWLVRETAQNILGQGRSQGSAMVQTLIAQITVMGKTEQQVFQQPIVRVGRSQMNDIVLLDPRVSQQHAILYLDEQGVSVIDLGSPNGLRLGSKLVQNKRERLNHGDVIRLSSLEEPAITVYWEKQPAQSKTPTEDMGTMDKLLLLFESSFLRSLKADALIELARDAVVRVYPQRSVMCKAGEPSDEILLLIDGTADVTVLRGDIEHVVNTVKVGETIGEMGVLTRQKRSASVVATAETNRALVIEAKNFEAVLSQDSELARNLLLLLSDRLQRLTAQVTTEP